MVKYYGSSKEKKKDLIGKIIIMGRCSFEEIGEPLPNKRTILISNTTKYEGENCITVNLLQKPSSYTVGYRYIFQIQAVALFNVL